MKKTISREIIICDICDWEIPYQNILVIELNSLAWHLCPDHHKQVIDVLAFLTIEVGLDISYKVKEVDRREIISTDYETSI